MLLTIPGVLDAETLKMLQQSLARAPFVDGRLTAGSAAKKVKNNQELDRNAAERDQLNRVAMNALVDSDAFQHAALPLRLATPFFARYTSGMAYGDHVDDPVMGGRGTQYRSDVSATLFLSPRDSYEGGELHIHTPFGPREIKLDAGDAVIYPSSSIHQVTPVTAGERLVMVTWMQSMVRDPQRRELLYELHLARESLLESAPDSSTTKQVDRSYVNLFRMWAEV